MCGGFFEVSLLILGWVECGWWWSRWRSSFDDKKRKGIEMIDVGVLIW